MKVLLFDDELQEKQALFKLPESVSPPVSETAELREGCVWVWFAGPMAMPANPWLLIEFSRIVCPVVGASYIEMPRLALWAIRF